MSIRVEPNELVQWLREHSPAYVVLRDADRVGQLHKLDDLDLLVEDAAALQLMARFSKSRGRLKVDVYGLEGRHKSDYHGFSHLPEALSARLIERRVRSEDLYVPHPADELHALLYHLCYHKAVQSGVHCNDATLSADNDYTRRVRSLLNVLSLELDLTLTAFDTALRAQGYAVTEERLIAYLQHDFRHGRKSHFHAVLQNRHPGELNLFVIRGVALKFGQHQALLERLSEHFEIVRQKNIPWLTRWRTRKAMRGGKWKRGGHPQIAVVVFDHHPQPSTDKEREVHPFVLNRNQFIKIEWREWFTANTNARNKDNPIHSTDNEAEALGHLPLFFDPAEQASILQDARRLRAQVDACAR